MNIYSVFDKVASDFNGVFLAKNHACAVRMYKVGADKVKLQDFDLYYIGVFDMTTGVITPVNPGIVSLSEYEVTE